MEGGVRMAGETGQIALEIRARNNLGAVLSVDDPIRAMAITRDGLALARKVGNRQMTLWLVALVALYGYLEGRDWDAALKLIEEHLDPDLEPFDRIDEQLEDLRREIERISDSQVESVEMILRGRIALHAGDLEGALRAGIRAIEIEPGTLFPGAAIAGEVGLRLRDPDPIRAGLQGLEGSVQRGEVLDILAVQLRAVIAALEGRRQDAVAGYREALRRWRELGLWLYLAEGGASFLEALGPSEPEARAAGEESREIFERLAARPWVERVDAVLAGRVAPILDPGAVREAARTL
jgi:tetratricopeptide (TPR) repeat protein